MSGWISKAVNVFRRDVPETPQLFEVHCECDRVHQGVRRSRHQHLVCKDCGASLFILPRDEYPPPFPIAKKAVEPPVESVPVESEADSAPAAEDPPAERNEPPAPAIPRKAARPTKKPETPAAELPPRRLTKKEKQKDRERREKEQSVREETRAAQDKGPSLRQRTGQAVHSTFSRSWRKWTEFWTPFRQIAGVFLLVVLGTVAWAVRQELLRRAVETVATGSEAGLAAIEQRNWIEARRILQPVVAALDRLGRSDPESRNLRQYFRETEALTRLSHASLFELVEVADAELAKSSPERWQELFQNRYQGSWLVIEGALAPITRQVGDKTQRLYAMNIPWSPGTRGQRIILEADFPVLRELPSGETPESLIFAGRLTGCRLDADRKEWIVTLEAKSGFLWSNFKTWESLGFGEDPEVVDPRIHAILDDQAKWSGVAP